MPELVELADKPAPAFHYAAELPVDTKQAESPPSLLNVLKGMHIEIMGPAPPLIPIWEERVMRLIQRLI